MKKNGVYKICSNTLCGKEYYVKKSLAERSKYCSYECMYSEGSERNKKISQVKLSATTEEKEKITTKRQDTLTERYGVTHNSQLEEVKESKRKTFLKKYGVDNVFKAKEIQEQVKKTVLDKYGVENVSQLDEVKRKKVETMLEKYGVEYPYYFDEFYRKMKQSCGGMTKPEKFVAEFLMENNVKFQYEYEVEYKGKRKRYDFYLPKQNVLIEFDGEYWHSLDNVKENDELKNDIAKELGFILVRINGEKDLEKMWSFV